VHPDLGVIKAGGGISGFWKPVFFVTFSDELFYPRKKLSRKEKLKPKFHNWPISPNIKTNIVNPFILKSWCYSLDAFLIKRI